MPNIYEYFSAMEAMKERLAATDQLTAEEKAKVYPCGYGHMAEGDIQMSIAIVGKDQEAKILREKVR